MSDRVLIRIIVNDDGYIEKEVEISPSIGNSEQVAEMVSTLIDTAFTALADAIGAKINII